MLVYFCVYSTFLNKRRGAYLSPLYKTGNGPAGEDFMPFTLLSGFLRTPKPHLRNRKAFLAALSFALLPLLAMPQAHAATQACKDGIKATVEGEIRGWTDGTNDRLWVTIDDTGWDCVEFVIAVPKTQKETCQPLGHGRATGIMSAHDKRNMNRGWTITDEGSGGKGKGMTSSFSCGAPRAEDLKPKK